MNDSRDPGARPPHRFGPPPRPPAPPPPEPSDPEPSLLAKARAAPMTFGLAAVNVVVFVLLEARYSSLDSTPSLRLWEVGANQRSLVLGGEYWRLATYMFLHIGWIHLVWNIYASVGFCAAVERALGRGRFLAVYLASGLAGGCASAIFTGGTSAGASGALFGIVGAILAIRWRQHASLSSFLKDPATRGTLFNIAIWTVIGSTALNMDNAAHLGGLVFGFGLTGVLTAKQPRLEWAVFVVALGGLFLAATRVFGPPPKDAALAQLTEVAELYLEGGTIQGVGSVPKNVRRGERFAKRACTFGSDEACALVHRGAPPTPN